MGTSQSFFGLSRANQAIGLYFLFFWQKIPAAELPLIFRKSLEPPIIVSLLHTFREILKAPTTSMETKRAMSRYMATLPRVARWKTVVLLLTNEEKKLIEEVWSLLADCDVDWIDQEAWGFPPC